MASNALSPRPQKRLRNQYHHGQDNDPAEHAHSGCHAYRKSETTVPSQYNAAGTQREAQPIGYYQAPLEEVYCMKTIEHYDDIVFGGGKGGNPRPCHLPEAGLPD
jgi:hypothetical protein